jgi:exodeoxyribonuclease VII small subunit
MAKLTLEKIMDESLKSGEVEKIIEELDFETGFKFLEQIVQAAENGNLSLEKAVISCERGAVLSQHLRKLLQSAEERLQILPKE